MNKKDIIQTRDAAVYMLNKISQHTGIDYEELLPVIRDLSKSIRLQESGNKNIPQANNGPGRGVYQVELNLGDGSGTNKTWIKRTKNTLKDKAPDWVSKLPETADISKLKPYQQDLLFLGNLYQEKGTFQSLREIIDSDNKEESLLNFWIKHHKKAEVTPKEKQRFLERAKTL